MKGKISGRAKKIGSSVISKKERKKLQVFKELINYYFK
jgi:hypothetical protein